MNITYDMMNPPISEILATYPYFGSPIEVCGNPVLSFSNFDGSNIGFLDGVIDSGVITITLPDPSKAVKGNYSI